VITGGQREEIRGYQDFFGGQPVDFANRLDQGKSAPHDVINRSETTAQNAEE
jgi:hypothetical protein